MAFRHKLLNAFSMSTDKLSQVHKLFKFSLYLGNFHRGYINFHSRYIML